MSILGVSLMVTLSLAGAAEQGIGWHKHDCKLLDQQSCLQGGCVWQPVQEPPSHDIPWCYYWTNKIDCYPEGGVTNTTCEERGCLWEESNVATLPWCSYPLPEALIDCHPDKGAKQDRCQSRGCWWLPKLATQPRMPYCIFPGGEKFPGYDVTNRTSDTLTGATDQTMKLSRRPTESIFGNDKRTVYFKTKAITDKHLRLQYHGYYYGDIKSHSEQIDQYLAQNHPLSEPEYGIDIDSIPFGYRVYRASDNYTIIDSRNLPGLVIETQFLNVPFKVPDKYVYGFRENAQLRLQRNVTWDQMGFFSRDTPPMPFSNSHQNLYGVHPFYLGIEPSGKAHGVYFNNIHGQNIAFQNHPGPEMITYRSMGGEVDFHVFLGDNPNDVIAQYVAMLGRPTLPPYWGLGFQLCRYGYKDLQEIKDTVKRVQATGTPLEIQYSDIDYMDGKKDFTVGTKFAGLGDYAKELHDEGMKMVLITDPAIASEAENYGPLDRGLKYDIFIRNSSGQILEGAVWPGKTYFPDFTHPNATIYWFENLKEFHDKVAFDGMWYDMNEVSNFVAGSQVGCPNTASNNPPYNPVADEPIYTKALCLNAKHYGQGGVYEYQLHNLYGYYETKVSYAAHLQLYPGKRPFMVSRSTAPGSGVHTAHWSGDVFSNWETMRYSIINMIQFSMFGIPWTGSDICGFLENAQELMCVRWQQLGAFYPFSRNHNSLGTKPQDPGVWSKPAQEAIKKAVLTRYKYLPYMYTLMVRAHVDGSTVVRALFFDYPKDRNTHEIDDQFLLGDAIMVASVNSASNRTRTYFPADRWYGLEFSTEEHWFKTGVYLQYEYHLDDFGLFSRGGTVIPWQEPSTTTTKSRTNPFGLVVSLGTDDNAKGELYWDDGVSVNSYSSGGEHLHFSFEAEASCERPDGFLVVRKDQDTYNGQKPAMLLDTVQLRGLRHRPIEFKIDDVTNITDVLHQPNGWIKLKNLNINLAEKNEFSITWK